jgi:dTDP-4-dehydrorhamnose 3,5-epimerase
MIEGMRFTETKLSGVLIVDIEPKEDERGFFARTWCVKEFEDHGLDAALAQCSISFNTHRGMLRGMHYQIAPHEESKLVRVTKGAIYDVALDLRRDAQTYKQWIALALSAENRRGLFIPKGCAHGFQALEDETEVHYMISVPYHADSALGVRWNDPSFGIIWPIADAILSERDRQFSDFTP